ncbi:MAG: hypothetical protein JOY72_05995 [Actinobacteria bacterium]|nr:hypothetical protein [Actinomycetota bacterium]
MRLLLRVYPRRWRDRYGDELLALLEAEPLTWRARANVVAAGLVERTRGSGPGHLRVLWGWAFFVVGGMAFQKTSEHWQGVFPSGHLATPTVAFDTVQVAAVIGSAAVLAGVALALPAFVRDLRRGGWTALRRPLLAAASGTIVAAASLLVLSHDHALAVGVVFVLSAIFALFASTHAAVAAARRLPSQRVYSVLATGVTLTMVVMVGAATAWFAAVTVRSPSFVGATQLAVTGAFMLTGVALAVTRTRTA